MSGAPDLHAPAETGGSAVLTPLVRRLTASNPSLFTGTGTNTYVLGAEPPYLVIDPGPDLEAHTDAVVAACEGQVDLVLVTHTHRDHSPGAATVAALTGAAVRGYGPMRARAIEPVDDTFSTDEPIADGEVIERPGYSLEALHTPGHASNHLCYRLGDAVFTGDHVMSGSTVVIAPLDGDMGEYLEQVERLRRLGPRLLFPGHGAVIGDPDPYLRDLLGHRAAREASVAAALRAAGGGATAKDLVAAVYTDVKPELHPIAVYTTWAILRKLAGAGLAGSEAPDEVDGMWKALDRPGGEGAPDDEQLS